MRTPAAPSLVLATCALAWVAACSGGHSDSKRAESLAGTLEGSNVLLITLDTTRADALGCYGGPAWSSPRLDAMAAAGVRFDQARTTNPVTLPSHASILTGQRPFEHGVRDNATFRLPERSVTLAERLSSAGYATGAVVGAFVLHSDFGLAQGFDTYSDVPRRRLEMDTVEDQRTATEVVDAALALLDAERLPEPFFLWVHLFDPHRPLDPPEPYRSAALEGLTPASPYHLIEQRLYHAEVAYADAQLGRLLDGLATRTAGELLVAFASDHGEGFGEHGEPAHGLQLFDTTMHVPVLLQHPRLPAGLVIETSISTTDLAPTVLGLLGLEAAGTTGRDLSRLLADPGLEPASLAAGPETPGAAVYLETCHSYYSYGWSPLFAVVSDGLKVIDGPEPAVYALERDPFELDNLVDERPDALASARAAFARLAPRTAPGERIELQDADRLALEQLGYTAGADDGRGDPLPPGRLDPAWADPAERIQVKELCQLAVLQLSQGDHENSVTNIRRVLLLDPTNPIFLSQAGTIFITTGHLAEAVQALTVSLAHREDASARCSLAVAHNLSGEKDAAILTLLENVALHPRHLHTRFALGELLLERGRPGDAALAVEHFEAFLAEHEADDAWHQTAETLASRARAAALLGR